MQHRKRSLRTPWLLALAAFAATALAACGGSSGDATKLLQQTFSGSHRVDSGNLSLSVRIDPSGSKTLNGPIMLSFGGPFQSLGAGKLPESDFSISFNGLGKSGSLGILSTGTAGYVTLQGRSYQLPAATFQRLESSFAQLGSSSGSGSGSGTLSKLGIRPLHWLTSPTIVGDETIAGAPTTHVRAHVNVSALLGDLNTFLQRAASAGGSSTSSLSSGISPSTMQRIANEVRSPAFDVWTGKSDKTIRKLEIRLTLPVSGQISTLLGGLRSAGIDITMQYANLNRHQTITAPTSVQPFSVFAAKVRSFAQALQGSLGSVLGGSGTTTGPAAAPAPSATTGSSGNLQNYTQCIQSAGGDVLKMQKCAPLLSGK